MTFMTLLVLMVATIFAAQLPHILPDVGLFRNSLLMNAVAIGIAVFKAYLVVSIFMGVKFATNLTKLFAIGGFVWFFLLFVTMIDYFTRPWEPVKGWEPGQPSALPRSMSVKE